MSTIEATPDYLNREAVINRLTDWLGEARRDKITKLVDDYTDKYDEHGPEYCEDELAWAVHVGKEHDHADLSISVVLADVLHRVDLDCDKPKELFDVKCRECE